MERLDELFNKQRQFFKTGKTLDVEYRIKALKLLRHQMKKYEAEIENALYADLGKSRTESYLGELGTVYEEIDVHIGNLRKWASPRRVNTPMALMPARSMIYREPYGNVLVVVPWNYPFQLAMVPLIGAISGGNTVMIKPSEFSPETSKVIRKIISSVFCEGYAVVVDGGVGNTATLLKKPFDMVFFTGSPRVGKLVMKECADNLTPVVLELGGKSPAIIDSSANLKVSVRRLAFGKVSNSGQICVAPDYVLVHQDIYENFVKEYRAIIDEFFPGDKAPERYAQLGKIINEKHYNRLKGLMEGEHIIYGGQYWDDLRKIEPTLVDAGDVTGYIEDGKYTDESKLPKPMTEEIFGSILPVIKFRNIEDVVEMISERPKPLALYYFGEDQDRENAVIHGISFGGGCVNDAVAHLGNSNLPFGGIGNSGMGSYHGERSFTTFTHEKSILKNTTKVDLKARYWPYTKKKYDFLKKIF